MKRIDTLRMRQDEAAERAEERAERSDAEQLERLRASGHGHCGEALTLAARIAQGESSS